MKQIIIKTALITLLVTLVLLISAFGIVSFCAPAAMMRFTSSIGMESLSGDYAYQEYERSGEIAYLARAFEIAANREDDHTASERFDAFYAHEEFGSYCEEQDKLIFPVGTPSFSYRPFICGQGACVKYRLAQTEKEKEDVCAFAFSETDAAFSAENPVLQLAVAAAEREDASFCAVLLARMREENFEQNADYNNIIKILEECVS